MAVGINALTIITGVIAEPEATLASLACGSIILTSAAICDFTNVKCACFCAGLVDVSGLTSVAALDARLFTITAVTDLASGVLTAHRSWRPNSASRTDLTLAIFVKVDPFVVRFACHAPRRAKCVT